jgi:hypothetical protein
MLTTQFFADPEFLDLLRYWDASRGGRALPAWAGDVAVVPRSLLPNLVVADLRGDVTYAYVGAECMRLWGSDSTGLRMFVDVLKGAHRRYVKSLIDELIAKRAPIYSTAVYQTDATAMIMTGRLLTPFTIGETSIPNALLSIQLFKGSEPLLHQVGIGGVVDEIRRDMITDAAALCARLEDARARYQVVLHTHGRTLVHDVDMIANELSGSALISLPCYEEPDPVDA